jgi:hypothetical protein
MDPVTAAGLKIALANLLKGAVGDGSKDIAKNFFKESIMKRVSGFKESPLEKALSRSLHTFVELFQQEVEDAECLTFLREQFEPAITTFIRHPEVLFVLGSAFDLDVKLLDTDVLKRMWTGLALPGLPEAFNWDLLGANYLRDVRRGIRGDPSLQAIFNTDNQDRTRQGVEYLAGVKAPFDLKGYAAAIVRTYQHLKLDTLDVSGQDYGVRLRKVFIFQDVREGLPSYDLPKELLKRLQDPDIKEEDGILKGLEELRGRYHNSPLSSVQNLIADPNCKHSVIVGDPGSGKSSLSQSLLLQWAESPERPLPILIELRSYTQDVGNPRNFLKYLEEGEGCAWHFRQHDLDEWMKKRETVFIFDGLDEVFDQVRRHETTRAILRFATEYPLVRIIVTSRIVGYYPEDLRNGDFKHFTLQEFSDDQIRSFLAHWHAEAIHSRHDRVLLCDRLVESLFEAPPLRELAGNPLLLTMLAMLNRHQELPRDRADAYKQMTRVLLHQWDVNKFLREHGGSMGERIGRQEKEEILRLVALEIQTASAKTTTNLILRERLEFLIAAYLRDTLHFERPENGARLIILQLQERNFILCQAGAEYFAFVHRTFLEYFCASALVTRFLATLSLGDLQARFLSHGREERWNEVLTLVVGMIPAVHAATLIDRLLSQKDPEGDFKNIFLAAACWHQLPETGRTETLRRKLWRELTTVADFRPAGVAFPIDNAGTVIPRRESKIMWTITVRTQAVTTIGAAFSGADDAFQWLKGCLANRSSWAMRQAAVRAISRGWPGMPEAGDSVRWAGRVEEDENVRVTAVREAARGWALESETLEWLKSLADSDETATVRRAAIQELARGWKDDPDARGYVDS